MVRVGDVDKTGVDGKCCVVETEFLSGVTVGFDDCLVYEVAVSDDASGGDVDTFGNEGRKPLIDVGEQREVLKGEEVSAWGC